MLNVENFLSELSIALVKTNRNDLSLLLNDDDYNSIKEHSETMDKNANSKYEYEIFATNSTPLEYHALLDNTIAIQYMGKRFYFVKATVIIPTK